MKSFILPIFAVTSISAFTITGTVTAQSTVFIVRHAEKADASRNTELSAAGKQRAESLATILKDAKIAAIYATEFRRTQQTAQPLSKATGVPVTVVPADRTDSLLEKLRASDANALVVGHTNTIPNLIKALGITDPVDIGEADYDNIFVVIAGQKPRLIRLHLPVPR